MALTYTPVAQLGSACPEFTLPKVDGGNFSSSDLKKVKACLVAFICNHCPYVQAIEERLIKLAREFEGKGLQIVGICSNDPTDHPEDEPAALLKRWQEKDYRFPYLIDAQQTVARSFGAVCTPDFFLYDGRRKLVYRGRLDDSWRNPLNVKTQELKAAVEQVLAGKQVNPQQNPSMGCSIKWKTGD